MCAFACFLASTLSCSELQVSRRLICAKKHSQEMLLSGLQGSGDTVLCPEDLKNTHISTQMTADNSKRIQTQMREEEKDLNCSKPLFDSIISISLRKKIRQKSHYDKWLISERICREPWRKRDLNRPSLSSPPRPSKPRDTLCLNSGLLSTSHLHECYQFCMMHLQ